MATPVPPAQISGGLVLAQRIDRCLRHVQDLLAALGERVRVELVGVAVAVLRADADERHRG
jgi:hypothetical protein